MHNGASTLGGDDEDDTRTFLYHERQESSLCGQHALNALLIGPYFSPADLAEIAAELDAKEAELMLAAGETIDAMKFLAEDSGNVNASGFFSVDVLRLALVRFGAIELIPSQKNSISQPSSRGGGEGEREALGARKAAEAAGDLTQELGFLVNRAEHWFALRRVGRRWWNLNSTLERGPEEVGRFYLSAFLEALVAEGYSVFLVRGEGLPERGYPEEGGGHGRRNVGTWYRVSDLVAGGQRRGGGGEGGGRGMRGLWGRLTGRGRHVAGEGTTGMAGEGTTGMGAGGKGGEEGGQPGPTGTEGGSEEEELARAIAMSLEER